MLCAKEKCFQTRSISLEQLVPANHFYRQLEATLDLRFVYELVKDKYAPSIGRPSIDPVVFFKLQLIMFFEGIRSERQLMATVNVNLAHRWYIGYDLNEAVPDHSSLSKIRSRYGLAVFQRFFEQVVELCMKAGLVWGKELYFDGSKIRANAAIDGLVDRATWNAEQHVTSLFHAASPTAPEMLRSTSSIGELTPREFGALVQKYDGTRRNLKRKPNYERTADVQVSPTDPTATPMCRFPGDHAQLGYHLHYVVDGGKARIILAALVTPASVMDNLPMLDLERWICTRWQVKPELAVGDTKYGTVENIVGLEQNGIRAFVPVTDFSRRKELYAAEEFLYDATRDVYVCPQGQDLTLHVRRRREEVLLYRAPAKVCNRCPVKAQCTTSRSGRHIFRSFFQEYLDRVRGYAQTEEYQKALRKRQVWVEPLFGEAKQWHQEVRFRLRGLHKVNIQGVFTAAGQNLKRWLHWKEAKRVRDEAEEASMPFLLILEIKFESQSRRCIRLFQHAGSLDDVQHRCLQIMGSWASKLIEFFGSETLIMEGNLGTVG